MQFYALDPSPFRPGVARYDSMGMDLVNEAGARFKVVTAGWGFYLNLAQAYGWEPAGTLPPDGYAGAEPWPGEYDWNAGQSVTSEDAHALASALQQALEDPERPLREREVAAAVSAAGRALKGDVSIEIKVDEDDSDFLREMIAFFREGSFQIW